ncbi:uncharacterized protein isoform X4 [Leptinotarsa decemlineata]|uniref:uncharacterized protein isoform X4 n=1 Tax=Leptinotarsa decemlineata TaxID=7539 RepID=UPI003D30A1C9
MATLATTTGEGEYEYGTKIKQEVDSFVEENDTLNSEEKCDAFQVVTSRKEFNQEKIKSEDIDVVYHDLKSECVEEIKEGSFCEVCGGTELSSRDFVSPDSSKCSCNCQWQNEFKVMKDPGIFCFETKEETVGNEEVINKNINEMKEILSPGHYSNSIREGRINEGNEICSKSFIERGKVKSFK